MGPLALVVARARLRVGVDVPTPGAITQQNGVSTQAVTGTLAGLVDRNANHGFYRRDKQKFGCMIDPAAVTCFLSLLKLMLRALVHLLYIHVAVSRWSVWQSTTTQHTANIVFS